MLWWCFFIFLLSLFQTCFLSSPSSSPQLCHPEERYALLQLKQKHYHVHPYPNYDPDYSWFYPSSKYRSLKSWKSNTDCCYWEGIICDGTTGHVVGLELSDSSLNGSIYSNSSLFHLRHLQMLNLSWNAFDYFTPSGFDRLSRLRHLNLSGNSFSGPIPSQISQLTDLFSLDLSFNNFVGQIPSEISRLTKLVFLDLSSERTTITSEGYFTEMYEYQQLEIPNFGAFVQNLSSLKELHLDRVNLSGPKNRDWCHQLSSALPNLHVLSLSDCALTGPLDASISSLRFLSELYLGSNQGLFSIVPSSLVNLTSLTVFSIWGCDFYGDFPSNVFLQPWVTHIDLSDNLLLSVHLPEFLQINNTLQYLCADGTDLQGKLPSSVGNLKSLKILRFSGCNLFGLIPPSLANLTHLTALDLSFNNLSGQIPSIFKESFSNLEVLRLGKNLLQGHIHSYLFFLPSLRILDLFLNRFSGVITEPIHNISSSFSSPRVFDFDLGGNYLKGEELMRPISKIKGTFKSLELSFNDFFNASGDYFFNAQIHDLGMRVCNLSKFPNFLRNQKELTLLDLSSNRIDGAIPKWIWKLQNLSSLDLSNNSFTGLELPLPTNHSFNIISLHLGSNMIHDSLPIASCSPQTFNQSNSDQFVSPILGNLTSLFSKAALYFSISDNNLTGNIPFSICNLSDLNLLDLSNNQLSGTIPTCPGSSGFNWNELHLQSNKLVGKIPFFICNASNLVILDLSKNELSGNIPTCLHSSNLEVLNLESNKLHGPIPPIFKNGCNLHTLKLNKNMLQGKVPRSLENCKELKLLDVGYNQLNDIFPYWLGNLSALQVLVMRSNSFGGPIAQLHQADSPFPNLHVFDLSFNAFVGNLPLQYILHWKAMMTIDNNSDSISYSGHYYQDTISIVYKGLYLEMTRILTTLVAIDLSNNNFRGKLPDALGNLKALKILNLSGNSLIGQIPFSLGNLSELESLDFSRNKLSGEIPRQLTSLTFLSVLNVSYNDLVGGIPQGNQFDTFSNDSYEGNAELCGLPLSKKCGITDRALPPASMSQQNDDSTPLLDWKFAVAGYCSGLIIGLVVGQQLFWRNNQYLGCILRIRGSKQIRKGRKRKHHNRGK